MSGWDVKDKSGWGKHGDEGEGMQRRMMKKRIGT